VPAIRLRAPARPVKAATKGRETPAAADTLDEVLDDEIPFAWLAALIVPWAALLLGGTVI
jgi:hypothetical protein